MSTRRKTATTTITVFLASVFAAGPVTTHAQEAEGAAAALDEITVTGRKREESLVDVPVSISVLSAELMAAQGIYTPEQLFQATVGLNFTSGFNIRINNETAVRGVRSESSLATQQTVSNFIDGMPMLGQPASLQFFGIDAVEVYRGPQSAAFGRSTFAGAINYVTSDSAEEFEGSVRVRATDLNHSEVGLLLTGPINDALGYRITYWNNKNDGADEWKGTDGILNANKETEVFSGKLNFEFSDTVHGEIFASHLEGDDGTPANWVVP